jgi:hypothetical protein
MPRCECRCSAAVFDIAGPYPPRPSMPPTTCSMSRPRQTLKWITAPSLQRRYSGRFRSINTSPVAHHSVPRLSSASTVAVSMDIIRPHSHRPSMPARRPPRRAQHPSRQTLNWMTAPSRYSGCHQHQHKPRGSSFCPTAVIGINCCCRLRV